MSGNAPDSEFDYRGRLAPSPTGRLHLGHARTFWKAQERAREKRGALILRNDDLDVQRCKPEFVERVFGDLKWFGLAWDEGPDCGGAFSPYSQSERRGHYLDSFALLLEAGAIYPCRCSRKDVLRALSAPHEGEEEPVYPGTCRPADAGSSLEICDSMLPSMLGRGQGLIDSEGRRVHWRFRVPDEEVVNFDDGGFGPQLFEAGKDFGDFVVWRNDDLPAYHLAVVTDDHAMKITEVVRGRDLLTSTARQLLVYRALGWKAPEHFHCPLVTDESGQRLAKRHDSLSLQALKESGVAPEKLRANWS